MNERKNDMFTVTRHEDCGYIIGAIKDNGDGKTNSVHVQMEDIRFTDALALISEMIEGLVDTKPGLGQLAQAAAVIEAVDIAIGNLTGVRPFEGKPCERKDYSGRGAERVVMDTRMLDLLKKMMGGDTE